ncbi:penicillin-binding protein 2 [Psychromarinibacter sp. C21-152]|uniref:Penicillin-binding protein 2 n=1 Tax=Psychromarinibacter sediminicola TaxID=3033385 RepID=A0AAE3T8Q0_9RHOB|nr:penicillin-binding protein 2 [Psychromarinibacter sediminicola]MDF0599740.1 penicillin-binding protein 2 [Psychromarinibacter sediminicola]
MTRVPLRPLARILEARRKGENPDAIERENIRLRHEEMRDRARQRAEGRLLVLGLFFFCAFTVVGARMGLMAASVPEEPRSSASTSEITALRADIVDRNGKILATNLQTHSLYAQPPQMVDPVGAAAALAAIFPDLDKDKLEKQFTGDRKFIWIKKVLSPEQQQMVHDIGEPGLLFGPREMRLYPNGPLAAHILGGYGFGREGVYAAEVIGTAGVEKQFDDFLRDPANNGKPLELSLDVTIQAAMEEILAGGMKLMNAKGATGVLMDSLTGEIVAMASLPDFDPNDRPVPLTKGDPSDSPLFNRAVQGLYELGSTFKIFAAAQAMELGLLNANTLVDADAPMKWGKFTIREFRNHNYGPLLSVTDVIVKSSNVGTARIALQIGKTRQQEFLKSLGLFDPTPVELFEAPYAKPLVPEKWSEIHTITVSYGHGLSASPLHLAAAYATVTNGGTKVTPTLVKQPYRIPGKRVISAETSAAARHMLRAVVTRGTASFGEVEGYAVAGKTGTADKPKPTGGYYDDKVIATFASVFPAHDPKYVLIVSLDEPVETSGERPRRTAGWTAVPVAAEIIRRVAPLLGLRPEIEPEGANGVTKG